MLEYGTVNVCDLNIQYLRFYTEKKGIIQLYLTFHTFLLKKGTV
jgi:hypothetical protein